VQRCGVHGGPDADALHFDAASAECVVFTFAEGLLAAFAHDLKLRVERFTLEVDRRTARVVARFEAGSLRVIGAMRGASEVPEALRESDRREIERAIVRDVLAAEYDPEILFVSTRVTGRGSDLDVEGDLTIRGRTRRIVTVARRHAGRLVAEVVLHKPDFGIAPYTALLGALRVKPDVRVRVSVPGTLP
jgi:hypothetical protein